MPHDCFAMLCLDRDHWNAILAALFLAFDPGLLAVADLAVLASILRRFVHALIPTPGAGPPSAPRPSLRVVP